MSQNPYHLFTAVEAEQEFGSKYFYRQRIYRLAESGKLPDFTLKGNICFIGDHVIKAFLTDLEEKISTRFQEVNPKSLRIFYDSINGKRIVVDGLFGKAISVDTEKETEEELLNKIAGVVEWVGKNPGEFGENDPEEEFEIIEEPEDDGQESSLANTLPEEISWIRIDTEEVEGVPVKSYILISLPSIAQFLGIRSDHFVDWLLGTTFSDFVLSAHPKKIHDPDISGSLKKGAVQGYIPLLPFELVPETLVAFRQSNRSVKYVEKADMLYNLSKSTLESVGLAISGNRDKAAEELARVGAGLGLNAADQIIGIFKQYGTKEYQVKTTKQFQSKVKKTGGSYATMTGRLTVGITGRFPGQWKLLGETKKLQKSVTQSGREVMRELSPADSIGMTFGEKHFIKVPNMGEAIETGKQGKDFFQRLKDVGLLDD